MDQIETNDRGVVQGDTWHRKEEFIRQEGPVTRDQLDWIFDYELAKVQLQMPIEMEPEVDLPDDGYSSLVDLKVKHVNVEGAYCIYRPDNQTVLVPSVGERFTLLDASMFIDWVDMNLLTPYPDLHVESSGTLYGGQTRFISIVLDEFQVAGDDSVTLNRILFTDPIGKGAYQACMNQTRVVCDNTRRLAIHQGKKNNSFLSCSHTSNGESRIQGHMLDLAEIRLGLAAENDRMDYFARTQLTFVHVRRFLDFLYPTVDEDGKPKQGRSLTIAQKKRDAIRSIFESQDGFSEAIAYSAYGLFNALSDFLGNQKGNTGFDVDLDNLTGQRADQKDQAMLWLMELCREINGF